MKKFIVGENYVINTSENALVRISFLDQEFINMFLGKNEEYHEPRKLESKSIRICRSDAREVFLELGGNQKAVVDLQDILGWAKDKCRNYEESHDNYFKCAFAFFVYDTFNLLRIIKVYFSVNGLDIYAFVIDDLEEKPSPALIYFLA